MDESKHRQDVGIVDGEWMFVELLGHNKIVGFVIEVQKWGQVLMRIDIPTEIDTTTGKMKFTTQFYGSHALYCATPIKETDAIHLAKNIRPMPFSKFDLHREANQNLDQFQSCEHCGLKLNICPRCNVSFNDLKSNSDVEREQAEIEESTDDLDIPF